MPESLEALIDDAQNSGTPIDSSGFNASEFVKELNKALNESSFYSKSILTNRNVRGIIRANAFQNYLEQVYGFRIHVLDELITDKVKNILSVNGEGRKQILALVEKGTPKIETKSGFDFADRMFGGQPPR